MTNLISCRRGLWVDLQDISSLPARLRDHFGSSTFGFRAWLSRMEIVPFWRIMNEKKNEPWYWRECDLPENFGAWECHWTRWPSWRRPVSQRVQHALACSTWLWLSSLVPSKMSMIRRQPVVVPSRRCGWPEWLGHLLLRLQPVVLSWRGISVALWLRLLSVC